MPGCSKIPKEACKMAAFCKWSPKKGCKSILSRHMYVNQRIFNAMSNHSKRVFSNRLKTKVFKQIEPDMQRSSSFVKFSDQLMFHVARYLLGGSKAELSLEDIRSRFERLKLNALINEGNRAVKSNFSMFCSKKPSRLAKKLCKLFGKKLSDDAVLFFAGAFESLYFKLVEITSKVSKSHGKNRLYEFHAKQAIDSDKSMLYILRRTSKTSKPSKQK